MISGADAELVARDGALPGLATLFDEEAFAAAAAARFPDVSHARCLYLRYKPQTACVARFRLSGDGGERDVYARATREGLSLHEFPEDRRIASLGRLAHSEARERLLARVLPELPQLWNAELSELGYRPEMRFVGRLDGADGAAAVVKAYAEGGFDLARRASRAFRSGSRLRVAGRLGRSRKHRVIVQEWLPGDLVEESILAGRPVGDAVAAAGEALAELHEQAGEDLPRLVRPTEAALLLQRAVEIGYLCPAIAQRSAALAVSLATRLLGYGYSESPLHGDFSPDQVLFDGRRAGIVDFDDAVRGDAARDLGAFVARLERMRMAGFLTPAGAEELGGRLAEGYRARAGARMPGEERIRHYVAIRLLTNAPGPFRLRLPAGPPRWRPSWPSRGSMEKVDKESLRFYPLRRSKFQAHCRR